MTIWSSNKFSGCSFSPPQAIISKKRAKNKLFQTPTSYMISLLKNEQMMGKESLMSESTTCLEKQPLSDELLQKMDAYWRAANYLSAGQLYLLDNPLLREPLTMDHVKKKIVGHWGTVPGQNFVWTHCNRVIKRYDLDMIYISGPGHGGNFQIANTYLEGSYSEVYPNISQDTEGMKKMFKQFSFPCGAGWYRWHAESACQDNGRPFPLFLWFRSAHR